MVSRLRSYYPGWTALLCAAVLAATIANAVSSTSLWTASVQAADNLPAAEFARLVRDLSEEGGYFRSDNFTSNETSYLHIVNKLREQGATGGAYIGVGPEQNFTYIAKVRPKIAFIIDIRRQAVIQHLMFKAIFYLAPTRMHYLSLLLSRPLPKDKTPSPDTPVAEMLSFFSQAQPDEKTYAVNLASLRRVIKDDFRSS
jgi:hypothetical protein